MKYSAEVLTFNKTSRPAVVGRFQFREVIPPTCSFEKVDKTFSLGGRTTLLGYVVLSYWNYVKPLFKIMCVYVYMV